MMTNCEVRLIVNSNDPTAESLVRDFSEVGSLVGVSNKNTPLASSTDTKFRLAGCQSRARFCIYEGTDSINDVLHLTVDKFESCREQLTKLGRIGFTQLEVLCYFRGAGMIAPAPKWLYLLSTFWVQVYFSMTPWERVVRPPRRSSQPCTITVQQDGP